MAACKFDIEFNEDIEDLIERARDGIIQNGGTFEGDETKGRYTLQTRVGQIAGTYVVSGNTLEYVITRKPGLVSCRRIEREFTKLIQSPAFSELNFADDQPS